MVSNVKYPRWPRIGVKSVTGILGLVLHLGVLAGAILAPATFLFPLGLAYMIFGIARSSILSLLERGGPATEPAVPASLDGSVHSLPERRRREGR
jgi:hypothetical protein